MSVDHRLELKLRNGQNGEPKLMDIRKAMGIDQEESPVVKNHKTAAHESDISG